MRSNKANRNWFMEQHIVLTCVANGAGRAIEYPLLHNVLIPA